MPQSRTSEKVDLGGPKKVRSKSWILDLNRKKDQWEMDEERPKSLRTRISNVVEIAYKETDAGEPLAPRLREGGEGRRRERGEGWTVVVALWW